MRKKFKAILQTFGIYRAAEVIYSIWTGKSLLWLAILSAGSVVISAIADGVKWASLDKYVLSFAIIYAALAFGWLATIIAFRKISPKNKLVVTSYDFNCNPVPRTVPHSNPQTANDFQAVINIQNLADFPISYAIEEIDFRVRNTTGNQVFRNRGAIIDAQQFSYFNSDIVSFHLPVNLPVEGTLRAKIKYGHPGKEKFEKIVAITVKFAVDPASPSGVRHYWTVS